MREGEDEWKWEEELPPPEELTPVSQSLISTDLALAFNIHPPTSNEFGSSSSSEPEPEQARSLKRARLVWTPQLHKRFVDAVGHLGIKNAVPKTIMQLMSVDGLTRENVASHLQKYRLYLKRMQHHNHPNNHNNNHNSASGTGDPAADRLFASSPVPSHFFAGGYVTPPPFHQATGAACQFGNHYVSRQLQFINGRAFNQTSPSGGSANGTRVLTLFPTTH